MGAKTSRNKSAKKDERIIEIGLTKKEKKQIVTMHNELRQKVAKGLETQGCPGPQPPAKHMPNVTWDKKLARAAQQWANKCKWGHDENPQIDGFRFGQNIAYVATTGDVYELKVEDMVQSWYDEVKDCSKDNAACFSNNSSSGAAIGHYTQMLWANSTKIGCGAVKYRDGNFNKFYLVCNYSPAGNVINEPMYEISK